VRLISANQNKNQLFSHLHEISRAFHWLQAVGSLQLVSHVVQKGLAYWKARNTMEQHKERII